MFRRVVLIAGPNKNEYAAKLAATNSGPRSCLVIDYFSIKFAMETITCHTLGNVDREGAWVGKYLARLDKECERLTVLYCGSEASFLSSGKQVLDGMGLEYDAIIIEQPCSPQVTREDILRHILGTTGLQEGLKAAFAREREELASERAALMVAQESKASAAAPAEEEVALRAFSQSRQEGGHRCGGGQGVEMQPVDAAEGAAEADDAARPAARNQTGLSLADLLRSVRIRARLLSGDQSRRIETSTIVQETQAFLSAL